MPPAVAAVAAAWTAKVTILGVITTWGAVIKTTLALTSIAYSATQQRKLKKQFSAGSAAVDQSRKVMSRDPVAVRRYIYGQVPVSGPIAYMGISGAENEYLHLVVVLASHECEELGEIKFGDAVVTLSGVDATGTYSGHVRIKKYLGIAAGERDTDLESESGGEWTAAHLGKGIARLHIRLKHNPDLFPEGIPAITCMVKGKKVLDTRTASVAWTDNAALCVADFLRDELIGKGVASARIREADLNEAANVCDETVGIDGGGSEKRYTINGTVEAGDPDTTLLEMVDAMQGSIADPGGLWTIHAGAYRSPVLDLGQGDLLGEINVVPRLSRADTFNGVRGTFISAINQWSAADFPPVKNDTYMGWDGGVRLWKDVAYNYTTSPAMAQRLAKIELERGRQQITVQARWALKAIKCQPGSTVRLTLPVMGWTNKEFTVVDWGPFDATGDDLGIELTLRETAEGVWDWANGEETATDLAPNSGLLNPRTVPTISGLTLSTSNFQQADGTITPRLRVQWSTIADASVRNGGSVEVEYKRTSDSDWLFWNDVAGRLTQEFVTDVLAGVAYDVRVRARNMYGVRGAYTMASNYTVVDDQIAPGVPSGLTAQSSPGGISLDWNDNTDSDLAYYRVHRSTSLSFIGSQVIATILGSSFVDQRVTFGTTYYYWIVAVDRTNNASAESVDATGTPGEGGAGFWPVDTPRIAFGAVTEATFVRSATATGITNNAWTEVTSAAVTVPAGQDVVIFVSFDYADDGAAFSLDMDIEVRRSGGSVVDVQRGQSVNQGSTEIISYQVIDPDLAGTETEYSLWVRPRGGGGSATPSIRNPTIGVLVLKDRENGP